MKKLALLLLCALLIPAAVACSSGSGDTAADTSSAETTTAETTAEVTSEEKVTDDLPALDFKGYEFKVSTRYAPIYFNHTLDTPEETGDVVNDAIFQRNRKVEERLNIVFTEICYDNATQGQDVPRTLMLAGDTTYDMFVARGLKAFTWATEGLLDEFTNLKYIDLDKPYWDQSINDALVIGGHMYFAVGAFNLTTYEWTHVLTFNKDMFDDFNLDDPYAMVKDGTWDYDEFISMAKTAPADLDGNGVFDANDRYGFESLPSEVLPSFWMSAELLSIEKDNDGYLVYKLPGNAKFLEVYTKVLNTMWSDNVYYNMPLTVTNEEQYKLFTNNQALFCNANFFKISKLRAMETDFGILPYPKWEESQDEYISRIDGCEMPVLPLANTDYERTGAILEALASESLYTVVEAYYDVALTGKYTRDEESVEMLDIISAKRVYDYGDTILTNHIRNNLLRAQFLAKNTDIVSHLTSSEPTINAELKKLNGQK